MKTALLTIGTEILFGQVVNTNAAYLSKELQNLGYDVTAAGTIDISEKIGRYQFTIKGDAANGVTAITLTDAGT